MTGRNYKCTLAHAKLGMVLDRHGGGSPLSWEQLRGQTLSQDQPTWVHLNFANKDARRWLRQYSELGSQEIKLMISPESRPRCVMGSKSVIVFLRAANTLSCDCPEEMFSLRICLTERHIITASDHPLASVQEVYNELEESDGPENQIELFSDLNTRLINHIAETLAKMDDTIDELEANADSGEIKTWRRQIASLRRQITFYRRYLSPQREAFYRLYQGGAKWLNEDMRVQFREATDRIMRYIEDLDLMRDRLNILQEEIMARFSEEINRRIYLLSIVAMIFLPLSFITSLLGVNLEGIPGAKSIAGFGVLCVILLVIGGGLFAYFKQKKWV